MNRSGVDGVAVARSAADWFAGRPDVRGVLLVGSYARGGAGPDSDIDLVILTEQPEAYRRDPRWHEADPWREMGARAVSVRDVEYGHVWSRHVTLDRGPRIEVGFASPGWASVDPPDAGTVGVMRDGHNILYDPDGLLAELAKVAFSEVEG